MAVLARASITLVQTVDITGYYRFYKLQSSTAAVPAKPTSIDTLPPSGWSATEPSYTEGSTNSLYFVDLTKYSDGTFEYSDVSLASSYEAAKQAYNKSLTAIEAVENMDIGGRNLLHNTNAIDLSKTALRPNINGDSASSGYLTGSAGTLVAATHGARITSTSAQRPGFIFGSNNPSASGTHGLAVGKEYTFSCDWETKTLGGSQVATTTYYLRAYLYYATSTSASSMTQHSFVTWYTFKTSDTSDRNAVVSGHGSFTFTVPEDAAAWNIRIYSTNISTASVYAAGNYLQIENVKLEEGNVPTAWSPAPEDFDTAIEEAAKVANNYFSTDTLGAMIADMRDGVQTPSTATGRNVLITNEDVQVRDGQASIASFGEGTRVGKKNEVHMEVESDRIAGIGELGETFFEVDANGAAREGERLSTSLSPQQATYGTSKLWHFEPGFLGMTVGKKFTVTWHNLGGARTTYGSLEFTYGTNQTKTDTNNGVTVSVQYVYNSTTGNDLTLTISTSTTSKFTLSELITTASYQTPTFSFGTSSRNNAAYSSSFGEGIISEDEDAMVIGRYNDPDIERDPGSGSYIRLFGNPLFVVGNGSDENHRSNAFRVHEDASVVEGDLIVTGSINNGRVITSIRIVSANVSSIARDASATATIDISDYDYPSPPELVIPYSTGWLTTVAPSSVSSTSITGVVWNFSNGSHSGTCQYLLIELSEVEE